MAKALYGHVGSSDPRLMAEVMAQAATLRRRVRQLEDEVTRLAAANDALTDLVAEAHLPAMSDTIEELDRVELPRSDLDVAVGAPAALTGV